MPRLAIVEAPGLTVGADYNANGRVNGVYVSNQRGPVRCGAVLTDGRVFSETYPPGEHLTNFPANTVRVVFTTEPESGDQLYELQGVQSVFWGGG